MAAALHVAVDARVVATDVRGIGRYARAILRRLVARDDVAFTLLIPELFPGLRRGALERALGSSRFSVARRVPRSADVTWFPANGTFFESRVPVVATVHDAVPFRYPNSDARAREREQTPILKTVQTARAFIAVSEFGKQELDTVFRIDPSRITTIYHGIDESFSPGEAGALPSGLTAGEYLLFIGDPSEGRKNFRLLYDAYRIAWPNGDGPPIAVAGITESPKPGVIAAGRIVGDLAQDHNDELRALYRGALAAVVPSYHETFGFPLLEAMACGVPAIASQAGSLPEIGGDAARFVAPHDAAAWTQALREIASDASQRAQLRERGLAQAASFSWTASAQAHLDLFARLAGGST